MQRKQLAAEYTVLVESTDNPRKVMHGWDSELWEKKTNEDTVSVFLESSAGAEEV